MQKLSDGIMVVYAEVVNKGGKPVRAPLDRDQLAMNQTRALQLLFDVKLVSKILPRKDDTEVQYL